MVLLEEHPQENPLFFLEHDVGHVVVDFFVHLPRLAPETHDMQPTNKGKLKLDLERTTCLCVMDSAMTMLSTILVYDQRNSHDTLLPTTAVAMS